MLPAPPAGRTTTPVHHRGSTAPHRLFLRQPSLSFGRHSESLSVGRHSGGTRRLADYVQCSAIRLMCNAEKQGHCAMRLGSGCACSAACQPRPPACQPPPTRASSFRAPQACILHQLSCTDTASRPHSCSTLRRSPQTGP